MTGRSRGGRPPLDGEAAPVVTFRAARCGEFAAAVERTRGPGKVGEVLREFISWYLGYRDEPPQRPVPSTRRRRRP